MNIDQYNKVRALNFRRALTMPEWDMLFDIYTQVRYDIGCKTCSGNRRIVMDELYKQVELHQAPNPEPEIKVELEIELPEFEIKEKPKRKKTK